MIKYVVSIERPFWADIVYIYLFRIDESQNKGYYGTIKDGNIEFTEYEPVMVKGAEGLKHLFAISKQFDSKGLILKAFAESLSKYGIFPEIDNKERIAAQAVAAERNDMLTYFKDLNKSIMERTINLTKEQKND